MTEEDEEKIVERYRDVCFTNYNDKRSSYKGLPVTYLVSQLELCPSSGRQHEQGFAQSKNPKSTKAWQKALGIPNAHCEQRRGTVTQAREYCISTQWPDHNGDLKDKGQVEDTIREYGEVDLLSNPGRRQELLHVKDLLDQGIPLNQLAERDDCFSQFCKHEKYFAKYITLKRRRKSFSPPDVYVRWGPTGTGKTRFVFDQVSDWDELFVFDADNHPWFDGYNGQRVVLIEEFRGQIPYARLLRILDGYPVDLPVKNSMVSWSPTTIYFTSPLTPSNWYKTSECDNYLQLHRRFKEVTYVGPA